jgi:hypothetical protein
MRETGGRKVLIDLPELMRSDLRVMAHVVGPSAVRSE